MKARAMIFCAAMTAITALVACHVPDIERFDPVSGTISGTEVSAPATIARDANGVVHIKAAADEDLFFAAGYAMAQDRFVLMDALRRAGGGTISELLGSPARYKDMDLPHLDIALRAFRFEDAAKKGVAELDPESRVLLESFTRGVNRYLEDGGSTIAIYQSWKIKPAPWRMEDCFLAAEIQGLAMTAASFVEEYYLERIRREMGDQARDLFIPAYPDDAAIITRDAPLLSGGPGLFPRRLMGSLGSNNWAISGKRTASGLPLLCNDPHVPDTIIPTFWWHCQLKSPSYNIMGMMFPGLPCFGAATNGRLAWALTNVMADYIDVWREKLNPDDLDQYMGESGKWEHFEKVTGSVAVRGKKPVPYVMRSSRHGVVIDRDLLGWRVPSEPGEVLVMRYVDMDLAAFFKGYQKMARAGSFDDWLTGVKNESQGPFAWNHVYADTDGNIAYWASGHFPIRADGQGYIARRGWDPAQDWQDYVPFEDNPHLVNPGKGYLVSANNRTELPGYPYYITVDYVSPSRATRISELIEQKGDGLDVEDMKRIQYDVADMSARHIVPVILADLEGGRGRMLARAADLLREWKGQGYIAGLDSRGTCIYQVFMQYFPEAVFKDEFNEHTLTGASYVGLLESGLEKIIDDPASPWFDDTKTTRTETRADITRKCVKQAMKYLCRKLGPDPRKWRWGDLSSVRLSPTLVPIPGLGSKTRGPFPLPGVYESVRANGALFISPLGFFHWEGPSTHIIIDFRNPRRAFFNASAGMADYDAGGRYDNLTPAWLDGTYRVMSMDEDEWRKDMMGEVKLLP